MGNEAEKPRQLEFMYYTTGELAEIADVDQSYIRRLLLEGRLEGHKRAGVWFVTSGSARDWLDGRRPRKKPGGEGDG